MFIYLILLFTAVPVIELAVLISVGRYIGVFSTIAIVILTGISGAYLAKLQGIIILEKMRTEINNGNMPADFMIDGFLVLCGGLLLLTPGFLTDIIGFIGLIPQTRCLIKRWLKRKIEEMINRGRIITIR